MEVQVSPQQGSPGDVALVFVLGCFTVGIICYSGHTGGPQVCLAAGFYPKELSDHVETKVKGGIKFGRSFISTKAKSYIFAVFLEGGSMEYCQMKDTGAEATANPVASNRSIPTPENGRDGPDNTQLRLSSCHLLIDGLRLVLTKTLALNMLLVVRVLWSPAAADKLIFRLLIQSSEVWTREPEVRPGNQRLDQRTKGKTQEPEKRPENKRVKTREPEVRPENQRLVQRTRGKTREPEVRPENQRLDQRTRVKTREPEVRPENLRLTVGSADKHTPSYYKLLSPNGSVACLASDFNSNGRTNQTGVDVFTGASEASRAPGEAFYSQVAVSADLTCPEDEKVNSLSLIMLGLRILFLKAVAFNVLLTLRLFSGLQRHLTDSTEDNFPPRLVFLDCNGWCDGWVMPKHFVNSDITTQPLCMVYKCIHK
ncbi:T-cell receptor delta chain C region [Merluccius polli]|nr:T-cell receptor delta chain C region [Merluccius polli]